MVRWVVSCVALALTACSNESAPTTRDDTAQVAFVSHPSLHMFDVALSSDAMQLSDVQIISLTAARAPLVSAIARLEGARRAYAEAIASALESGKIDGPTLALAAADLSRAVDAFGPVDHTAKSQLFHTLDDRQQALLGPWPDLAPNKIDLDLDRAALAEALSLRPEGRARWAARIRAGASLRD